MSLRGWLSSKASQLTDTSPSLTEADLERDLEHAIHAANYIFDDDLEAADKGLHEGDSSFHKLGRGLTAFVKATLGFEQDAMKDARDLLAAAEASALNDQRQVLKEPEAFHSKVYNQGAEYTLVSAQAQLMSAVVGVLNESLTEAIKGFYKARKAYLALEALIAEEERFLKGVKRTPTTGSSTVEVEKTSPSNSGSDSEDGSFVDAAETTAADSKENPKINGHAVPDVSSKALEDNSTKLDPITEPVSNGVDKDAAPDSKVGHLQNQLPTDSHLNEILHPIDLFVHSGANMCFGMLLLLLSMVPPTFSKLLWIVGFQGNRDRGLKYLWNASQFDNVNGAIAGLVVLAYFDTFVGFCDILPPDEKSDGTEPSRGLDASYPAARLEALLSRMRQRYPKSRLWVIEQARMHASKQELDSGIELLLDTHKTPLKQVQALAYFERSLQSLYAHRYALSAESILECSKMSNWSPTLYHFNAACAYVQLYRDAHAEDHEEESTSHAEKAIEHFTIAKKHFGKKKLLARQLPFDAFAARKVARWEARMSTYGISMMDAIGNAPGEEITYHFGGIKKMNSTQRNKTLANLEMSNQHVTRQPWGSADATADELAVIATLQAAVHRAAGNHEKATKLLEEEVLNKDPASFKIGEHKEDWLLPVAHYEMAATLWAQREDPMARDGKGASPEEADRMRKIQSYLEKAARGESYDLEARVGMRVTMGLNTMKKWLAGYDG